jgi:TRAP-type C4-dicarboxylate transport system permease small subunit
MITRLLLIAVLAAAPKRAERFLLALADVIVLLMAGLVALASVEFTASSWGERTPILPAPAKPGVALLPHLGR